MWVFPYLENLTLSDVRKRGHASLRSPFPTHVQKTSVNLSMANADYLISEDFCVRIAAGDVELPVVLPLGVP